MNTICKAANTNTHYLNNSIYGKEVEENKLGGLMQHKEHHFTKMMTNCAVLFFKNKPGMQQGVGQQWVRLPRPTQLVVGRMKLINDMQIWRSSRGIINV